MKMRSGRCPCRAYISYYTSLCYVLPFFAIEAAQVTAKHAAAVTYSILYTVSIAPIPRRSGNISVSDSVNRRAAGAAREHYIESVVEFSSVERAYAPAVFI